MASCDYCNTSILFGGIKDGGHRFCNEKCHQAAHILAVANQVPEEVVNRQTQEVFHGNCPKCGGLGPIEVHKAHKIWSAIFMTRWESTPHVCCRTCAIKAQAGAVAYCLLLGWWGFPWGLVMTPVQAMRNVVGMIRGNESTRPSEELRKLVQVQFGVQVLARRRQSGPTG